LDALAGSCDDSGSDSGKTRAQMMNQGVPHRRG
jgi:hypothetical protein